MPFPYGNGGGYNPETQMNPIIQGFLNAFSMASQLKQQSRDQADLELRQHHEKRLANAEDIKQQMELQQSGATPVDKQGNVPVSVQSPDQQLQIPGTPGITIPGQTQQSSYPAQNPVTANNGTQWQLPSQAETLRNTIQSNSAIAEAKNASTLDLYKKEKQADDDAEPEMDVDGVGKMKQKYGGPLLKERETTKAKVEEGRLKRAWDMQKDAADRTSRESIAAGNNRTTLTAAQIRANNAGGDAPKKPTPVQLNAVESEKQKALTKAEFLFKAATVKNRDTGKLNGKVIDSDLETENLNALNKAKQDAQDRYESKLKQFGIEPDPVVYGSGAPGPAETRMGRPRSQMAPVGTAPLPQQAGQAGAGTAAGYLQSLGR